MKKVFLDTNVLIDYLARRGVHHKLLAMNDSMVSACCALTGRLHTNVNIITIVSLILLLLLFVLYHF